LGHLAPVLITAALISALAEDSVIESAKSWNSNTFFLYSSQNSHNQAGIVPDGGLRPLLELLDSKNGSLQHNAAFALYGLADNEVRNQTWMC
jgi:hypothetical protein